MDSPILLYANDVAYKKFVDITLENYGDMRSQAIDLSLNDYGPVAKHQIWHKFSDF